MLDTLFSVIKQCNFQDAKNTSKDACLLGPPSLEFAPYGRVPGSRIRKDGRQGTIDQDPEFIDFLQSLTEPVTRSNINGEGESTDNKTGKATTTPLVEYLKEKKANKGKDAIASKTAKASGKPEAKEAKSEKTDIKKVSVVKKEAQRSPEKAKVEKGTQDAVKAVNKSVAAMKGKSDMSEPTSPSSKAPPASPTMVKRERERGSASVAAKILQRDLGLVAARGDRRTSRGATSVPKAAGGPEPDRKTGPASPAVKPLVKASESTTSTVPTQSHAPLPAVSSATPTGPRVTKVSLRTSQPANRPVSVPPARPSRPPPTPAPGAKSAFLKHANFSQGVTEEGLHEAFSTFGAVARCEIDRKKGFGYVDFDDAESLKRAMLASPVKVGTRGGQVVVLENKNLKSKPQTPMQHADGKASVQPQTPPTLSPKPESVEAAAAVLPVTVTPTAPRGAQVPYRGGPQHQGARGGYVGPPRGGYNRAGRGGRANFRGRGAFDNNRGGLVNGKTTLSPGPAVSPTPSTPLTSVPSSVTKANTNGPAG